MATELHAPGLGNALIILAGAGIVIPLFARIRITPVIGFILFGVLVGPAALGALTPAYPWLKYLTITDVEVIAPFAELGVILLLFSIGLELSFRRLWDLRALVFGVGAAQLLGCGMVLAAGLALFGGADWGPAAGLGIALALSSTALVLRISGTKTAVGRAAFAMLLFEDLALVPIIFLLGAVGSQTPGLDGALTILWQGAAVIAVLAAIGWWALPIIFAQAARTKSPEVFLAASLLVVIAAALATGAVGLSPIFGALLAGFLIAETEYSTEVEAIIDPFKGLALGVFLISIGMSLNLATIAAQWPALLGAVLGVLVVKALVTGLLLRLSGARRSTAAEVGVLMASPSETTLIVLAAALAAGLISADVAGFWQLVTAIGLTITPLLARLGHNIARRIDMASAPAPEPDSPAARTIIIGCGRVGQTVAGLLKIHGRRYLAVDADIDAVAAAQRAGFNVRFADVARSGGVRRLGLDTAEAVVMTMDDPVQQLALTRRIRARYPDLPIIARARDGDHATRLYEAGASDAVPETLESSLQLGEAVLLDLGLPMGPVIASIHEVRASLRREIIRGGAQPAARPPRD